MFTDGVHQAWLHVKDAPDQFTVELANAFFVYEDTDGTRHATRWADVAREWVGDGHDVSIVPEDAA